MVRRRIALHELLDAALHIRPGEGRRVAILFLHLLLASAVFILGRTVRDTLFLSRYPIKYLPWMFVLYGITSSLTALVYGRYADRVARHRLIVASTAVGITTYLGTWVLVQQDRVWIYPAFYVWTEVVANLFVVQFWTLANDLFDARQAKRVFGTIGAARLLGVVIVGLGAGAVVRAIGTTQLLFVLVALMAGIAICALALRKEPRADVAERGTRRIHRQGKPRPLFADPYVQSLSLMILLIFVALTIGDYQFKRIARAGYSGDDLARFFSLFYAGTGVVAFLFQMVATPRILARLGVGYGLAVMPAVFGSMAAALLFLPKLAIATVMKFADNGFQYSIHETTLQALYVPFTPEAKARTRAALEAMVKPAAYGLGGLMLVLLAPHMSVGALSLVTVPIAIGWAAMIPQVRRRYLRRLEATLSARGALALDHDYTLDAAGRRALLRTLEHGEPAQILIALEQLAGERGGEVPRALARLASHPEPAVRVAALARFATNGGGEANLARVALADPVPSVRAAAAAAYAALARDDSVDDLAPLLTDPSADVRVAAVAGLLRHGGVEGGIVGGAELGRLLIGSREDLVTAARALQSLGPGAYRPLRKLLADPDPGVRRAALAAAPGVADPRLVPLLLDLLSDPPSRRRAGKALIAVGPPAVEPLGRALSDPAVPRGVKLEIPRMLKRIAVEASYDVLKHHVRDPDSHLRLRVYAALSSLRRQLGRSSEPVQFLLPLVQFEITETYRNQQAWAAARERFHSELLEEEFQFRRQRCIRRLLRLLELRADRDALRLVREHLHDPARRVNALEVLDTLLDPPLRPLIMPFVDELPEAERLRVARELAPSVPDPEDFLRETCRHPNPYVVVLALDALSRAAPEVAREESERLRHHLDPLVRQAAGLIAGEQLPEGQMYSTLEKVLLLKRAPIFAKVHGEDLAALARVAEEAVYGPGEPIMSEGEMGEALFIIVRGSVAVARGGHQVATMGPGQVLGEMSVFDREPRSASATAIDETEVLWIGSEEFYEILHEQVEIAEGVIRTLNARLRETTAELGRVKAGGAAPS